MMTSSSQAKVKDNKRPSFKAKHTGSQNRGKNHKIKSSPKAPPFTKKKNSMQKLASDSSPEKKSQKPFPSRKLGKFEKKGLGRKVRNVHGEKNQNLQAPSFLFSVASEKDLPKPFEKEIIFFGASNVGKSSLINALCNRNNLAKTSKTPGHTRLLNFFTFPPYATLVDAPGYGFATASLEIQRQWDQLILTYLRSRKGLAQAFILIDARRFLRKDDLTVLELLRKNDIFWTLVLTKIDKLRPKEKLILDQTLKKTEFSFIKTSSKDKIGIDELQDLIRQKPSVLQTKRLRTSTQRTKPDKPKTKPKIIKRIPLQQNPKQRKNRYSLRQV